MFRFFVRLKPDLRVGQMSKQRYRRHLPHQIPNNTPIFLTWNLKGALPQDRLIELQVQDRLDREQAKQRADKQDLELNLAKKKFARRDNYFDTTAIGPNDLAIPEVANIVEQAILLGSAKDYQLYAWCVMSNHVHVFVKPHFPLAQITQKLKGGTARQINQSQQQEGRVFWQDESYDHWSRDEEEFFRIIAYIENNPVKAGLCVSPEEWRWSSARYRTHWPRGQVWVPSS